MSAQKSQKTFTMADTLPLSQAMPDRRTILTKTFNPVQVIYVRGVNFSGLTREEMHEFIEARYRVFSNLTSEYRVSVYYQRKKIKESSEKEFYPNKYIGDIAASQQELVKNSFRTDIFISVTRDSQKALSGADERSVHDIMQGEIAKLNQKTSEICGMLNKYDAHVLHSDYSTDVSLMDFWGYMVNSGESIIAPKQQMHLNRILTLSDIEINEREGLITFISERGIRYGSILRINAYPEQTFNELLDTLAQVRHQFTIYQYIEMQNSDKIKFEVSKRANQLKSMTDNNFGRALNLGSIFGPAMEQYDEVLTELGAGEIQLARHNFNILVYGDTQEELQAGIGRIKAALIQNGISTIIERDNLVNTFWAQFPDMERLNSPRAFTVTNKDVVNFVTFSKTSEGYDKCSFGKHPSFTFLTPEKTAYNFIFHSSDKRAADGNTLLIGPTGGGKTTLAMALAMSCLKYRDENYGDPMRMLMFDSGQGLRVPVTAMNGEYININKPEAVKMNPFLLPKSDENRKFLIDWVVSLLGGRSKVDELEYNSIVKYVENMYAIHENKRNLSAAKDILQNIDYQNEPSLPLYERIKKWMPDDDSGEAKGLASYFNDRDDALHFKKQIVAFNMKIALNDEDLLSPLAMHIFHSFTQVINNNPSPHIIFFDEMRKYLANDVVGEFIKNSVLEIRKRNGIFFGAIQSPSHLLDTEHGQTIKENIATMIFLPNPQAKWAEYEAMGLNDAEFDWVRENAGKRLALIKKAGGQSVIVNTDFSHFGAGLHLLSGDITDGANMVKLSKQGLPYPDIVEEFLKLKSQPRRKRS